LEKTQLKNAPASWDDLVKDLASDRRGGKRLNLSCPIEISGIDRTGVSFSECTKTQDISERGCRMETSLPLERGDIVAIKLLLDGGKTPDEAPHFFEIMWTVNNAKGRVVGARKLQSENIWKVSFPPVKSSLKPRPR